MPAKLSDDVAGIIRKGALTTGASAGLGAAGTIWTSAIATGTAAVASPAGLFLILPLAGGFAAWKAASWLTDKFTD